jgi:hypothetical protein
VSQYTVYADEAWTHDPQHDRFWRFYGGAMVASAERQRVENELVALKSQLGLQGEIKWSQVRRFNWERVAVVIDRFLDFVEAGDVKLRYMWLDQGFHDPAALNDFHREYGYYILYYFFVVFGFGLPWHDEAERVNIVFFPDTLPDQPEKRKSFQQFLYRPARTATWRTAGGTSSGSGTSGSRAFSTGNGRPARAGRSRPRSAAPADDGAAGSARAVACASAGANPSARRT